MLTSFTSWYRYADILKIASLLVFRRKTDNFAEFDRMVYALQNDGAEITVINAEIDDISSTEIREAFETGKIPSKMVSTEVLNYLTDNKIYGAKN